MLTLKDRKTAYRYLEDVQRRRARNLAYLVAVNNGNISHTMKLIGQSPAYFHAVAGEKPVARMGEAVARKAEALLRLPEGWMDQDR